MWKWRLAAVMAIVLLAAAVGLFTYQWSINPEVLDQEEETVAATTTTQPEAPEGRATIYATVGMHSELASGTNNPDYINDEERFWQDRNLLLQFATMLKEEGATFDFMSDVTFLEAVLKYDKDQENTNGKNIIQYLSEDLGVSIDPHAHETNTSNYADGAYLVEQLGVQPTGVVGGFLIDQGVDRFRSPIEAKTYDYAWTPTILWGGGTGLHQNESQYWASGIWRPKSDREISVDDPNGTLPNIGNYVSSWSGLDDLLEKNAAGELDADKIYTITIMTNLRDIAQSGFVEDFKKEIDARKGYQTSGEVVWLTLPATIDVWKTKYNSEPNRLPYTGTATSKDVFGGGDDAASGGLSGKGGGCGDGVCRPLERQKQVCPEDCGE